MTQVNPLETVMGEMVRAAETGLNMVALAVAVALPAICASLGKIEGRSNGDEYKAWCEGNLSGKPGFTGLSPEELYAMRCGLLHQGRVEMTAYSKAKGERHVSDTKGVTFLAEDPCGNSFVDCGLQDRYLYSVKEFCANMRDAVRAWLAKNDGNATVLTNLEKMMRYRPFESPAISFGDGGPQMIY